MFTLNRPLTWSSHFLPVYVFSSLPTNNIPSYGQIMFFDLSFSDKISRYSCKSSVTEFDHSSSQFQLHLTTRDEADCNSKGMRIWVSSSNIRFPAALLSYVLGFTWSSFRFDRSNRRKWKWWKWNMFLSRHTYATFFREFSHRTVDDHPPDSPNGLLCFPVCICRNHETRFSSIHRLDFLGLALLFIRKVAADNLCRRTIPRTTCCINLGSRWLLPWMDWSPSQ